MIEGMIENAQLWRLARDYVPATFVHGPFISLLLVATCGGAASWIATCAVGGWPRRRALRRGDTSFRPAEVTYWVAFLLILMAMTQYASTIVPALSPVAGHAYAGTIFFLATLLGLVVARTRAMAAAGFDSLHGKQALTDGLVLGGIIYPGWSITILLLFATSELPPVPRAGLFIATFLACFFSGDRIAEAALKRFGVIDGGTLRWSHANAVFVFDRVLVTPSLSTTLGADDAALIVKVASAVAREGSLRRAVRKVAVFSPLLASAGLALLGDRLTLLATFAVMFVPLAAFIATARGAIVRAQKVLIAEGVPPEAIGNAMRKLIEANRSRSFVFGFFARGTRAQQPKRRLRPTGILAALLGTALSLVLCVVSLQLCIVLWGIAGEALSNPRLIALIDLATVWNARDEDGLRDLRAEKASAQLTRHADTLAKAYPQDAAALRLGALTLNRQSETLRQAAATALVELRKCDDARAVDPQVGAGCS